jgi:RNA 2',3'-cyclic 3'-phosphodiesterase
MEKRLFIGVKIDASDKLCQLISGLKHQIADPGIRWVEPGNLHLTLMFLGDVRINKIPGLIAKLKNISLSVPSFDAKVIGLGRFAAKGQTKVIWAGFHDEGQLGVLAKKIISGMSELGFQAEARPFQAHLTLGRVKATCNEKMLEPMLERYQKEELQNIEIGEFILFESILKPSGPIYMAIESFPLQDFSK